MLLNSCAPSFSRAALNPVLRLVFTGLLASAISAQAQSRYPVTPEQQRIAEQTAAAGVPLSELADNAPDQHTIVSGDTLWGISSKFLKSPWRWPQLWGMNKEQIKNPHLIYPGQTLYLLREGGRARLVAGAPPENENLAKLSPEKRSEYLAAKSIPAIPSNIIEPFLSQPLIVGANTLNKAPRVMASQENRLFLGSGDTAYVRGIQDDDATDYSIYRPAKPLRDPDTRKVLAYEAVFLGTAKLLRRGDPATFLILNAKEEIGIGDRLAKVEAPALLNYVPRAPEQDMKGRVVSIYGGVKQAGTNQVVTVSIGSEQGLEVGDVLALYRTGEKVKDRTARNQTVKLPDEQYGVVFIFRIFDKLAYGLVMGVRLPVEVGDTVQTP